MVYFVNLTRMVWLVNQIVVASVVSQTMYNLARKPDSDHLCYESSKDNLARKPDSRDLHRKPEDGGVARKSNSDRVDRKP